MTAKEIKKAYQRAKKAYEMRTGEKHTWVMNCRQQQLGTATIMCAVAWDYEDMLRRAKRSVENFDKFWADRMKDYEKRAAEEARKNERTPGWYFGKNNYFWQEVVANTEEREADRQKNLATREATVKETTEKLEQFGPYSETFRTAIKKAEDMIGSHEIQNFLKEIGGRAFVEPKEHGGDTCYHSAEIYIRFQYSPGEDI